MELPFILNLRISCDLTLWISYPLFWHSCLLTIPCNIIYTTTTEYNPITDNNTINTKWIEVEYAIFFFTSICPIILIANKITTNTIGTLLGINIIRYTLATTIVDECNKDETGVGLSIATGNQYCQI